MASTFIVALLLLSLCLAEAKDLLVGGNAKAWKVPSSPAESLNRWAEANRFQIDDTLVWKINGSNDSVLQVTRKHYLGCNASAPLAAPEIKDGEAKVKLERPGAYYFISGAKDACVMGQRLIVVVMSPRSSATMAMMSPAPSPAEAESPVPAAVSGVGRLAVAASVLVGGVVVVVLL